MKDTIVCGMALVCGLAIARSAASDASKGTKATKDITLTGCLQAGDGTGTFKLTNVTGGPSATNTGGPSATHKEWELMDAPASLKMTDHVGHKVSVTGTVMEPGQAKKAVAKQSAREEGGPRHLQVQSFKHVAATCP